MKYKALLLFIICSASFSALAQTNGKVGFTSRKFVDSTRSNWLDNGPRPMRSIIWYPSNGTGTKTILSDKGHFPAPVDQFQESGFATGKKKYPLIIMSHGSGGNARQMEWLGYYLASQGYIAVAIDHNGTPQEEKQPPGGLTISDYCMWERPQDIHVVLNKMLKDKFFASKIDQGRIATAGFSLGGASAIWATGAIFNRDSLVKYGPPPPAFLDKAIKEQIALTKNDPIVLKSMEHMSDSYKDPRIKAVFALGPAIGQGFPAEGLKNVTVPVKIVVGEDDKIATPNGNAKHYAAYIKNAELIVIPGEGGHYLAPAKGNEYAVDLRKVSIMADEFFRKNLNIR